MARKSSKRWSLMEVGNGALCRQNDWYVYLSTVSVCVLGRVSRLSIEAEFGQLKEFLTAFFLP